MKKTSLFLILLALAAGGVWAKETAQTQTVEMERLELQLCAIHGVLRETYHARPFYNKEDPGGELQTAFEVRLDSLQSEFRKVLERICRIDSAMEYDFPHLSGLAGVEIATSPDRKLRVFSRDTHQGGTMPIVHSYVQFKTDGTGGGSDVSYEELLPLIYTGPVRSPNMSFLATPLNTDGREKIAAREDLNEDLREQIAKMVEKMKARPGELVPYRDEEIEIETRDNVYEFPRNVGVIVDGNCASSTEQFLLAAKQSLKVKLFGTTTFGALDASDMLSADSPDGQYRLHYTTSLSPRIPGMAIDDVGLQPDYYLGNSIPGHKWV